MLILIHGVKRLGKCDRYTTPDHGPPETHSEPTFRFQIQDLCQATNRRFQQDFWQSLRLHQPSVPIETNPTRTHLLCYSCADQCVLCS